MKLVTVDQMRQIERHAHQSLGWSYDEMMTQAGKHLALLIRQIITGIPTPKITFLIGKGNNGGDALIACRLLAPDYEVRCYLLEPIDDLKQVDQTNIPIYTDLHDQALLPDLIRTADLVVDGVFGIGVRLPLRENYARVLRTVNPIIRASKEQAPHQTTFLYPDHSAERPQPIKVLAVDCPSGVDCDTGQTDPNTIPADLTLTFIAPKIGQVLAPALSYVGELVIAPIGIPSDWASSEAELATLPDMKALLPHRPLDANKGTFGKAFIIGGCSLYYGAPALSAMACYRSGTGVVSVGAIQPVIDALASQHPEPTYIPLPAQGGSIGANAFEQVETVISDYDSLLIGVGMGNFDHTIDFLMNLLQRKLPPLILDADALNSLAQRANWWENVPAGTIITPHPGEMARLTGLSIPEIQANRISITRQASAEWGVTILLKGAHSVIASPDGAITILPFKSSALATAGTGDLLAGIIAGLKAQGLSSHSASVLAGYIHGLAGTIIEKRMGSGRGVIASDILQAIPDALRAIERG